MEKDHEHFDQTLTETGRDSERSKRRKMNGVKGRSWFDLVILISPVKGLSMSFWRANETFFYLHFLFCLPKSFFFGSTGSFFCRAAWFLPPRGGATRVGLQSARNMRSNPPCAAVLRAVSRSPRFCATFCGELALCVPGSAFLRAPVTPDRISWQGKGSHCAVLYRGRPFVQEIFICRWSSREKAAITWKADLLLQKKRVPLPSFTYQRGNPAAGNIFIINILSWQVFVCWNCSLIQIFQMNELFTEKKLSSEIQYWISNIGHLSRLRFECISLFIWII